MKQVRAALSPSIRRAGVGIVAAVTLFSMAACSSNGTGSSTSSASAGVTKSDASISVRGCTPQNPLIPTNTNEVCGGDPLDAAFAKLIHYNSDTAAPELDIASSITSADNATNWTIKLKQGYKFQDGTEVKAKNFVDAWNWGADCANAQVDSSFFAIIDGFVDPTNQGCNTQSTMSGLQVVDDYTFTIKTAAPTSNLETRLGYVAFAPEPDSFFADTSAGKANFAKAPIGAGPFQITTVSDTQIVLTRFDGYSGQWPGSVKSVTFKIYNDMTAAYQDVVANNLDATDTIPSDFLVGDQWKTDAPNRWGTANTGVIQILTFAPASVDPNMQDVRIREALSLAIDRNEIAQQVFNGARTPADDWVTPAIPGYQAGACTWCKFDPTQAKQLYDAAGGYPGTLKLTVNGDGGHDPWANAVCNQLKNNLGVNCVVSDTPDFATLRDQIQKRQLTGMYRGGWQMDYPSIEDFLTPIYTTGASSNDSSYANPQFDSLIQQADAAPDDNSANALYQQAIGLLDNDFPTMPLFFQPSQYIFSNRIKSIKMTPFSTFDFSSVVMN